MTIFEEYGAFNEGYGQNWLGWPRRKHDTSYVHPVECVHCSQGSFSLEFNYLTLICLYMYIYKGSILDTCIGVKAVNLCIIFLGFC